MNQARRIGAAILILAIIFGAGAFAWRKRQLYLESQFRPFETNTIADVSWTNGNTPMRIDCTVVTPDGKPVPSMSVHFGNNSGGNSSVSDAEGHLHCDMAETDLDSISINRKKIMSRPDAYFLGYPNVTNGLQVRIVVKHPEFIQLPDQKVSPQ